MRQHIGRNYHKGKMLIKTCNMYSNPCTHTMDFEKLVEPIELRFSVPIYEPAT